jgi:hypothetical protein
MGRGKKYRLCCNLLISLGDPRLLLCHRSNSLEIKHVTYACDCLRKRRGADAERSFDDARLAADVARDVEDRCLTLT